MFRPFNFYGIINIIYERGIYILLSSYPSYRAAILLTSRDGRAVPEIYTSKRDGDLSRSIKLTHIFPVVQARRISRNSTFCTFYCRDNTRGSSPYRCRAISQSRSLHEDLPRGRPCQLDYQIEIHGDDKSVVKPYIAIHPINHDTISRAIISP